MSEERPTSIKLKIKTRDRLADYGKKSETFDEVVNRLLDEVEAWREKARVKERDVL
ncbi:MAG: DUF7557 family protein [Methanothrix sp.]